MPLIGRWRPLAAGDKIPTDSGTQELEGFSMFRKVTALIYYCNVDKNICTQAITSTVFILSADPKSNFSRYSTSDHKGAPTRGSFQGSGSTRLDPSMDLSQCWVPSVGVHNGHPRFASTTGKHTRSNKNINKHYSSKYLTLNNGDYQVIKVNTKVSISE